MFFSSVDSWNGYHSIPVKEESRHFLTFNTEWGRFRYKVAPQGFLGSGDHYTRTLNDLFDNKVKEAQGQLKDGQEDIWCCPITKNQVPMKRCIDDTLTWAGSFEDAARKILSLIHI